MDAHKAQPYIIEAALHRDERGELLSCNEFNMADVQRMYLISPASTEIIRAWQAHRYETKWFYCVSGSFEVKLLAIDDLEFPDAHLLPFTYCLEAAKPQILCIPGGYANGFRACTENSSLMVFSNYSVAESQADDFRYPAEKWNLWEK